MLSPGIPDIILGCDPGVHGALAGFIDGQLLYLADLPNEKISKPRKGKAIRHLIGGATETNSFELDMPALMQLFRGMLRGRPATMLIEEVHPWPGQGSLSSAKLVKAAAQVRTLAETLGVQCIPIEPGRWKTKLGLNKDKGRSCAVAAQQFPHFAAAFKRKSQDHNRAEAALIGLYGVRWIP
jgi:hypothetical protein